MTRNAYQPLRSKPLQPDTGFASPMQKLPDRVGFDDPAESVMTDLARVSAVVIRAADTVDEANRRMIQRGVRLLLVVDHDRRVLGIVTATDVLGEKPMKVIAERGGRHEDVLVSDIMTPQSRLEALEMQDVRAAKVGHIVATLKAAGRQHTIVVERDAAGTPVLRGMFSLTQIARQLGVQLQASELARTFYEIESLLAT